MEILIVAATSGEIAPSSLFLENQKIDVLITGVGMVETAFALGNILARKHYDLLLNVGVAGSFAAELHIGDVVEVIEDQLIELGAENRDEFLTIGEMGLGQSLFIPDAHDKLLPPTELKKVNGITVNTVHGNAASIEAISKRFNEVTIESMEGAAVFHAAQKEKISVLQVRAISNYVEARDSSRWNMPLAIDKLNEWLLHYVICLQSS